MAARLTDPLIWRSVLVHLVEERRAALIRALSAEGIELLADTDDADDSAPILLLLGEICAESFEAVQRLSCGGSRRLVVVLAPEIDEEAATGWELMSLGASEVLPWQMLLARPGTLGARLQRWQAIDQILTSPLIRENLIGSSPAWITLLRNVVEVARYTTAPVLLLGESGTGKELLARLIHTLDPRPENRELVVLDCTTVVPELSGSEFFGHERGAFTNAHVPRDGAFALAHRGTLFLDEIGELPPPLQAQLLRVVQENTYKRLGSNTWQHADFRLICATNRNLWDDVTAGGFRRDLYYRLAGWVLRVPSLRERGEDVLPLARHFLTAVYPGKREAGFDPAICAYLTRREYPGNIRDLRQLVLRIGMRHVGDGPISFADIPDDERPPVPLPPLPWPDLELERAVGRAISLGVGLKEISRVASEIAVRQAMQSTGNLRDAARCLGVTDRALQMRQAGARTPRISPSPALMDVNSRANGSPYGEANGKRDC